ncbi:arginase [Amycolatopsis antarctica]|uniref:Arginase n=1 Tax=Amycolatopsis antarctica TaxID=1854586 RepID=A0A263DBV5_9PSEU|nr:arginase family protein [Amycolatopsis antarctica]OZM74986.1 arginase [Amycolatopsis antarctica]
MPIVHVPYHQDERLPPRDIPLAGTPRVTVDPGLPEGDLWERLGELHDATADAVAGIAGTGAVPTVVSGDCLTMLGTVTGLRRAGADPAVVWLDAHGDVHTLDSSTSGYPGGMALRFLLGALPDPVAARLATSPVAEDRVLLVDARDLDPAEETYLATAGIRRCSVPALGPDTVPDGALVLHVDVDVIDEAEVPGLRFPVTGGPSGEAVLAAVRRVLGTGRVAAFDIACPWHPAEGEEAAARRAALLATLTTLSA